MIKKEDRASLYTYPLIHLPYKSCFIHVRLEVRDKIQISIDSLISWSCVYFNLYETKKHIYLEKGNRGLYTNYIIMQLKILND